MWLPNATLFAQIVSKTNKTLLKTIFSCEVINVKQKAQPEIRFRP
jgi:hypothetical protein